MATEQKAAQPHMAGPRGTADERWDGAVLRGLAAVFLSLILFIVIPDRLVTYLSRHVVPAARDLIVLAWVTFAFLLMCWAFVRLQGRRDN
jgi:hypothetical protein